MIIGALLGSLPVAVLAQDQPHKFEVGLEVASYAPFAPTYATYASTRLNDKAQWASGLVFRYNLGRFGLRSGASYNTGTDKLNTTNCNDCLAGETTGHDLRVRLGAQYAPFAQAPWLYVFSDFYYRRYTSEGNFTGGFTGATNTNVMVTSNGVGNSTGVGLKVRTWKHFYLNPEVYYDVVRAHNTINTIDRNARTIYQTTSTTTLRTPSVRLNAIFAF